MANILTESQAFAKSHVQDCIHDSWHPLLNKALETMDPAYLDGLVTNDAWLPGLDKLFAAFHLPLPAVKTLLLGESPYPRAASANGYAFWDGAVSDIWSKTGLSKSVNRATSLRHIIKCLLRAEGVLDADVSQDAIAQVDKTPFVTQLSELFENFLRQGFLLLNTSLVLSEQAVARDAKAWRPFMACLLEQLSQLPEPPTLLLWGNIAKTLATYAPLDAFHCLACEHPYNVSFVMNPLMHDFFAPQHLLRR